MTEERSAAYVERLEKALCEIAEGEVVSDTAWQTLRFKEHARAALVPESDAARGYTQADREKDTISPAKQAASAAALPRTIYVKVSTALLAELGEWCEPVLVKVERDWNDDTFEMIFKREGTDLDV